MGRRPGLSINDKNIALGLLEVCARATNVARRFGCNERTIYLQQRERQTCSVNGRPGLEIPRITTPRKYRYIVTSSRRHRFMPATSLMQRFRQVTGTIIYVYAARNRLRAARLRARRPYKGVLLKQRHRVALDLDTSTQR